MRARDHGILRAFPLALSALLLMGCGSGGGTAADTFAEASPDVLVETSPETAADALDDPDADLAPEPADDVPADVPAPDASDATEAADSPDADGTEPDIEAVRLFELETPVALTPDGRTALLWTYTTGEFALADTVTGHVASKGILGEPQRNVPTALSPDLHVTALHGEPVQAGLWSESGGWRDLDSPFQGCVNDPGPPVQGDLGSAWDLSDDGQVVAGMAWDGCATVRALLWVIINDEVGSLALDPLGKVAAGVAPRMPMNRATVVSSDGRIAAGFAENGAADRSPAIWNEDRTGFLLDPSDETNPGEVKVINADGTFVAGDWGGKGFTWTQADGVVKFSASASEFDTVLVNAMSGDGGLVFGTIVTFDPDLLQTTQKAFVWSAHTGVRPLAELAADAGIALPEGSTLTNVLSVSSDGRVILGTLTLPNPDPMGWPIQKSVVLRLPLP